MMVRRIFIIAVFFLGISASLFSQGFTLPNSGKSEKISFELVNNLIIIPVELNGAELSFILDSGVGKPILFNLADQDSIQLNEVSEMTIRGLGTGDPIKALSSRHNKIAVKGVKNYNQHLYVVLDKDLNFSPALGVPVHGIIGYDLFRDFVVEINYGRQFIRFHDPEKYRPKRNRKGIEIPLVVRKNKSFIEGQVWLEEAGAKAVRLLVDTGSSDALWLLEDQEQGIAIPEKFYEDYLGLGLNGHIYGKRTKIKKISIGGYELQDAKAAFPNKESFGAVKDLQNRNGSMGGEVLKRFNMVFNYPQGKVYLQKNSHFTAPFHFNMSGIEIQHNGVRYIAEQIADNKGMVMQDESTFGNVHLIPGQSRTRLSLVPEIVVSAIRAGSPAAEVGLREGDIILAVNGRKVHQYKLQEIMNMLNEKQGKKIRLLIERYNKDLVFSFVLKELFE